MYYNILDQQQLAKLLVEIQSPHPVSTLPSFPPPSFPPSLTPSLPPSPSLLPHSLPPSLPFSPPPLHQSISHSQLGGWDWIQGL